MSIWGCGYLRYFSVKGIAEEAFSFNTRLTAYTDCLPISGYSEFVGLDAMSITFNGENGDICVGSTGWQKDKYVNIIGFFVATQKIS